VIHPNGGWWQSRVDRFHVAPWKINIKLRCCCQCLSSLHYDKVYFTFTESEILYIYCTNVCSLPYSCKSETNSYLCHLNHNKHDKDLIVFLPITVCSQIVDFNITWIVR
jgi:hypothetical protein